MIDIYKTFLTHIVNMAVNGTDAPSNLYDNTKGLQESIYAAGKVYYKIYAAYEDYENEYLNTTFYRDNTNVIPALIITTPELYFKGLLPYKGELLSIRNILDNLDSTSTLPKINFFIIPMVVNTGQQFAGSGMLSIYIDYNTYVDIYGIYGKDLAEVINYKYYQPRKGEYFYLTNFDQITQRVYTIYFVPKTTDILYERTVLNRIKFNYTIRYTSVVKSNC